MPRLAHRLLTRAGTMRWEGTRGSYKCDLGLGGSLIPIGTAAQIWNREAAVTVDMLTRARAATPALEAVRNQGRLDSPDDPARTGGAADATQLDVIAMRRELRHQFDLADQHWQDWTPR